MLTVGRLWNDTHLAITGEDKNRVLLLANSTSAVDPGGGGLS